jgi:hypothetical protein
MWMLFMSVVVGIPVQAREEHMGEMVAAAVVMTVR